MSVPARRPAAFRKAGAILALLVTLASAASSLPASPASAAPVRPVELVLTRITPEAPGPKSTLRITGHLAALNTDLRDVSVRLRYSSRSFVSRGVLAAYAAGSSVRTSTVPAYSTRIELGPRQRNGAEFTLQVPVSELGMDDFGVYPIAVEVLSQGRQVALQRTFLTYVPSNFHAKPTRIAWVWPLTGPPHRGPEGMFIDDELSNSLSPDGRLGRLLDAAAGARRDGSGSRSGRDVPITFAVDPALLTAAADMTDGYRTRRLDTEEVNEQDASSAAEQWLDNLRDAVAGQNVVSLPYADPDVMALHRAGLDEDLRLATSKGPDLTSEVLGRDVRQGVVWPPGGWLDQDTLDTLAGSGAGTVILNENSLPPENRLSYTPSATTRTPTVGGTIRVHIADSTLTQVLGSATAEPGSAVLAEQRFLAETALITAELPNRPRTLLAVPPRRWEPPAGFAAGVLTDSANVPWLRPVPLEYLRRHPSEVERAGLRYPPSVRRQELDQSYLAKVRKIHTELQRFAAILDTRPSAYDFSLLRTESSAWRTRRTMGIQLRQAVDKNLDAKRRKVRIVSSGSATLTSDSGTVPVTVANNLDEHPVTVHLELRPVNRARLRIGNYNRVVHIGPGQKKIVDVRMSAVTSGSADVMAQLETPEGKKYGESVRLEVTATGYGSVALAITGIALGVLFLAVAARLIRRTLKTDPTDDPEGST